jgi:hypothetical protein
MAEVPGVDALYDAAAEDFVAARDALAKALRSSGERDAAALVKQLRRPTRAAWALNQLARRHADDVRSLVDLGRALADAQEQALAGHQVDLRQAGRARMEVVRHLTRLAEGILGPGAAAQRDEVVATLTAASTDPAAGAELVAGRLAEPLGAPAGFGDALAGWGLAGSTTTTAPDERTRPGRPAGTARRRPTRSTPTQGAPPPADLAAARAATKGRLGSTGAGPPADLAPARAAAKERTGTRRSASTGAGPPADLAAARARAQEAAERAEAALAEARAREAGERADAARAAVASATAALATSTAAADGAADRARALEAELDAAREEAAAARAAAEADAAALETARREAAAADRAVQEAEARARPTGGRPG